MKKLKKLNSGMTLVEVVIAMAIFSVMTLGITMAFAAAIKFNARNMRRDYELNVQQEAIQKATAAGVEIYGASFKSRTIQYVDAHTNALVKDIPQVTEYNAVKSAQNGSDFNFEMKTFSSVELGSTKVAFDPLNQQYKITVSNLSSDPVDVRFETTSGTIYEGDPTSGYRHCSTIYKRSVAPLGGSDINTDDGVSNPSGFEIGYENDLTKESSSMTVRFYQNGSCIAVYVVDNFTLLNSLSGTIEFKINATGTVTT